MIEYKYKKRENKFTENGHTMFETDVLQRLKRLADLEEQIKQKKLLPIQRVSFNEDCECKNDEVCGLCYPKKGYEMIDNELKFTGEVEVCASNLTQTDRITKHLYRGTWSG